MTSVVPRGGGRCAVIAATAFARPSDTTQYAVGDLVADSTTAGSVTPIQWSLRGDGGAVEVVRVRVQKSTTTASAATFRVHLYESPPTAANGDNGAWATDVAGYLGYAEVIMAAFSDDAYGIGVPGTPIIAQAATGSRLIYGLIEARGAYAPGSAETFTATLEVAREN